MTPKPVALVQLVVQKLMAPKPVALQPASLLSLVALSSLPVSVFGGGLGADDEDELSDEEEDELR